MQSDSSEKIVVRCSCGKKYKLAPEKAGKKFRCQECGKTLVAAEASEAPGKSKAKTVRPRRRALEDATRVPRTRPLLVALAIVLGFVIGAAGGVTAIATLRDAPPPAAP